MAATLVSLSFFTRGSGSGGRREFEGKPFLITRGSNLGVSLKNFFISPALLNNFPLRSSPQQPKRCFQILTCLPSSSSSSSLDNTTDSAFNPSTKLYVSGLSFRTTEEGLRNAFLSFGQLLEVKLVMDKIANRSRGFAFLRYATEDESKKAIEGMHGKFLDGRVIFVEVAKPRSELRHGSQKDTQQYR